MWTTSEYTALKHVLIKTNSQLSVLIRWVRGSDAECMNTLLAHQLREKDTAYSKINSLFLILAVSTTGSG